MSNTVIKVSNDTLSKMKDYYAASITANTPSGAVFSAKVNGATITAYKSGKVLFQGNNTASEAKKWGTSEPSPSRRAAALPSRQSEASPTIRSGRQQLSIN